MLHCKTCNLAFEINHTHTRLLHSSTHAVKMTTSNGWQWKHKIKPETCQRVAATTTQTWHRKAFSGGDWGKKTFSELSHMQQSPLWPWELSTADFLFFFLLNLTVQWASQAESHWTGSERRKRTAKRRRELHVCDNLAAWGSWLTCWPNEIHQGQKNKTLKMKTDAETFFNVIELPPPDGTPPVSLSEWRSFFLNSRGKPKLYL